MQVGARRATVEQTDGLPDASACHRIGADRELIVTIDDPSPDWN